MFMILGSINVLGSLADDVLISHRFDTDSVTQFDDVGNFNGTVDGATYISDGFINGAYSYDGSNDQISFGVVNGADMLSINCWVNGTPNSTRMILARGIDNEDFVWYSSTGIIYFGTSYTDNFGTPAGAMPTGIWTMVTATINLSTSPNTRIIYVNGVLNVSNTESNDVFNSATYYWGEAEGYSFDHKGGIDECVIWNKTLDQNDIDNLYNSGDGLQYPFITDVLEIDFFNQTPINNSDISSSSVPYNLDFEVNITDTSEEMVTCNLYEDDILRNTSVYNISEQVYNNITRTFDNELNYTTYTYNLSCNHSSLYAEDGLKYINLFIDTDKPVINIYSPINDTLYGSSLFLNVSGQDNNLYFMNITITDNSSTDVYTKIVDDINDTHYNYTENINSSSWAEGSAKLNVTFCDGHTDILINFDDWTITKKEGIIDFGNCKIYSLEDVTDYNYVCEGDRCKWDFMYSKLAIDNKRIQYIECKEKIKYVKDSEYKGHLISGMNWIDAETDEKYPVDIIKINDYKYMYIYNTDSFRIVTNSIGQLNCDSLIYDLDFDNTPPEIYLKSVTPDDINLTSFGLINFIYEVYDNITPINESSLFFKSSVNHTSTGSLNYSWRIPSNTKAEGLYSEQRAVNRNEGDWYEYLFDNIYEWGVRSSTNSNFTITYNSPYNVTINLSIIDVHRITNEIYPLDRTALQSSNMKSASVYGNKIIVSKFHINEIIPSANYILHLFANGTSPSPLRVWYCNESFFNAGESVTTTENCHFIGSITSADTFDYSIGNVSYHQLITIASNTSTFDGVKITRDSYFVYESNAGISNPWRIWYSDSTDLIGNVSFNNSGLLFNSSDLGQTIVSRNGTVANWLAYLHNNTDEIIYGVYGCNNISLCDTSEITIDSIGIVPYAPNRPAILSLNDNIYLNGSYNGVINITTILGEDLNEGDNVTGNLSLINVDGSFNMTINGSFTDSGHTIEIFFNTSLVNDGIYRLNLTNCDDGGLCSDISSARTFIIDNSPPYFNHTLGNISYSGTGSFSYDVNASDLYSLIDSYMLIEAENYSIFSIDQDTGIITGTGIIANASYLLNLSVNDTLGNINESQYLEINYTYSTPPVDTQDINDFQLDIQTNVFLLFVMVILYLGVMALGFAFKNVGFASLGFFIGVILGFMFYNLSGFMTLAIVTINCVIFFTMARKMK